MKRPCPIVLDRCGGQDSPITNTSSEDPDPVLFAGIGWTQYDPWAIPPLGDGPNQKVDCSDIVWSDVSQVMANLLAQINAAFCTPPPIPPLPPIPDLPPMPVFPPLPTAGRQVQACNDEQTVSVICPDGATQTFVIAAGVACETLPESYVDQWKAFINDWLVKWYTIQAQLNCPGTPDELVTCFNDRQEASVTCPDGTIFTAAIEAGTVTSPPIPQSLCVAWKEYANATLLAQLLQSIYDLRVCAEIPNLTRRTPPGIPPSPPTPNPRISAFPGWSCLGVALDPQFSTYNVVGGGSSTWNFEISGSIPPGTDLVTMGSNSAELLGTPNVPGTYGYTVTATSGSSTITIHDVLHVLGLKSLTLDNGTTGVAYTDTLEADGGVAPFTFSGTAPAGLTLHSNGTVSGTPTLAGTFAFDVTVTDANGGTCTASVSISINSDCPDWATMSWDAATVIQGGLASGGGLGFQNTFAVGGTVTTGFFDDVIVFLRYGHLTGYNGHGCSCKVTLDRIIDLAAIAGSFFHQITVERWNGAAWIALLDHDWSGGPFDHIEYTFSVPDSLGTPYDIRVSVSTSANTLAGGPGQVSVSGNITNI